MGWGRERDKGRGREKERESERDGEQGMPEGVAVCDVRV